MAFEPTAEVLAALRTAASATGVPLSLLWGVAFAESSFDPSAVGPVTASGERAQGLMQLMPKVAAANGVTDPLDAAQSAMGGARELRKLGKALQWNVSKMLAAYNWGPINFARAQNAGQAVPASVAKYVRKALAAREVYRRKAPRPEGSIVEVLNAAIEALSALNPTYAPATKTRDEWRKFYAAGQHGNVLSVLNNPILRAHWRNYSAAYERAPLTDETTPAPELLEPSAAVTAAKVVEDIKEGAGDAALGIGGGLFVLALFWFAASGRRR